jgi:hypothetical protein
MKEDDEGIVSHLIVAVALATSQPILAFVIIGLILASVHRPSAFMRKRWSALTLLDSAR